MYYSNYSIIYNIINKINYDYNIIHLTWYYIHIYVALISTDRDGTNSNPCNARLVIRADFHGMLTQTFILHGTALIQCLIECHFFDKTRIVLRSFYLKIKNSNLRTSHGKLHWKPCSWWTSKFLNIRILPPCSQCFPTFYHFFHILSIPNCW